MKRSLALVLTLALGLPLAASAQSTAPAPTTIAVIAFQTTVTQTNEFQRSYADLEKKYAPKRQQLAALNTEIENLTKQLQAQASTLSAVEQANQSNNITAKKTQLQRDTQEAESDFQSDMQNMFQTVAAKVYKVMTDYAKAHGYNLVLDASESSSPILYAVSATNITKPVLEAYNLKSGIPAPPAAAAAPKPATGAKKLPSAPLPANGAAKH